LAHARGRASDCLAEINSGARCSARIVDPHQSAANTASSRPTARPKFFRPRPQKGLTDYCTLVYNLATHTAASRRAGIVLWQFNWSATPRLAGGSPKLRAARAATV